jgi:hypothetical protein
MTALLFVLLLSAGDTPWTLHLGAQPPFISASVEPVPASHAALHHGIEPTFTLRCLDGRIRAELHAATLRGVEPVGSNLARGITRVRFAFDDGEWKSGVWARDYDVVAPSDEFMKRFEGARHALIEVRVMCRDCGAAPPVAYKIEGTGFSDARAALVDACSGSTTRH